MKQCSYRLVNQSLIVTFSGIKEDLSLLPRDAMRKRGLCCDPVSVRLSVCLSRSMHSIQTAEDIVKLLRRPGSPIILVFLTPGADTQFQGEPLQRGRKIQGGRKFLRFSTEIAVYLGKVRDRSMVAMES